MPLPPDSHVELNKQHYGMKEKEINNVGAGSGHFLMGVTDTVVMFYGYIFPCLDSRSVSEAGDSVRRGESSSGLHTLSRPKCMSVIILY